MKNRLMAPCAMAVALAAGSVDASVITDWNNVYLQSIRELPEGPGPMARKGALLHTAIYDAVNSFDKTHEAYLVNLDPQAGASKVAAIARAARDSMIYAYPTRAAEFESLYNTQVNGIPAQARADGEAIGAAVAAQIISSRDVDGWNAPAPSYPDGTNPGEWRPTLPDFGGAVGPGWGNCVPWAMNSPSQFRPAGVGNGLFTSMGDLLASQEYADNVNEVKELGRLNSGSRTPDETEAAFFWANDRNGTYKPPGHLNAITQEIANVRFAGMTEDQRLSAEARLFALANIAMADAGIAAWDAKYNTDIDLWRPIDAIRQADTDGNPNTTFEPDWEPLNHNFPGSDQDFTPPFPAWISGHSTFGGVHAAVLEAFFGSDEMNMLVQSEDPSYSGDGRFFATFSEMGLENALSRIWLGVHYRFDCEQGYETGQLLGQYIGGNFLRAIPAPGSVMLMAIGGLAALQRRRSA